MNFIKALIISLKKEMEDKSFRYAFIIMFAIATPFFMRETYHAMVDNRFNFTTCTYYLISYLFCILSLPQIIASKNRENDNDIR